MLVPRGLLVVGRGTYCTLMISPIPWYFLVFYMHEPLPLLHTIKASGRQIWGTGTLHRAPHWLLYTAVI